MSESMTYLGRNPCGCISFLIVDEPGHEKAVAREVARGIRNGMTIERVETAWVRTPACSLKPCQDGPCVRAKQRRATPPTPEVQACLPE